MPLDQSFTFYTFTNHPEPYDSRWADCSIPDFFFDSLDAARQAVAELREDMEKDGEAGWSPVSIEKIETRPLSKECVLALLNDGVEAFISHYEIVDVIE